MNCNTTHYRANSSSVPGDPTSPYKGLLPYSEEDAAFFFGRETEQDIIGANLQAYRLTLLYGASGVGKSSVLRAGVAHHLNQLAARSSNGRGWPEFFTVVFGSWRDDPVATLVARVRESIARASASAAAELPAASSSLAETLARWTTHLDSDLLVILDQFEEYFLYHPQEDGPGTFASEMPRAIGWPGLRANFLISIREDSLAKLDRFKGRLPNLFDNYLRIDHLGPDAARAAIEKPIEQFNRVRALDGARISIEPALVDAVLDQVRTGRVVLGGIGRGEVATAAHDAASDHRIETPYLQLVMIRQWKEERAAGSNVLRLETLTRLGGADRIVRTHLDDVMNTLTPAERQAAARAFRYLVTPSGTKIAHTISDLAEYADLPPALLQPVAEKLSSGDVRIIRPIAPPPDRPTAPRYEIFHDVLAAAILDWQHRAESERHMLVERTLEPLHRGTWALAALFLLASTLLAVPLAIVLTTEPESFVWKFPGWFFAAIAFVGLAALCAALVRLLIGWRRIIQAVDTGFRWRVIADVMADRRGDVGNLLARTGRHDILTADQGDRIRLLRRLGAALIFSAAAAPLVGLLATVALGSRGVLRAWATLPAVFGPSAFLLMFGVGALLVESFVLRRAWSANKQAGGLEPRKRGRPSSNWSEGVLPDVPRRSSFVRVRRARWLIRAGGAALIAAVALLTLPIAAVSIIGPLIWQLLTPSARVEERIRIVAVGESYRLPVDPTISPLAAGEAYYTLGVIGRPAERYDRPLARRIDQSWRPDEEETPFGNRFDAFDPLVARAAKGFNASETSYLERLSSHPGFEQAAIVARAREIDYLGARLLPSNTMLPFTFSSPSLFELRKGVQAHLAKAALELSKGERTEAEATLRQGVSFALAIATQGYGVIDVLIGSAGLESALKALEDLYSVTDDAKARTLRADRQAATALRADVESRTTLDELRSVDLLNARRNALNALRDARRLRAFRWEALSSLALAPCTNAQELVFGPGAQLDRAFELARTSLVRFPSEQRLLDNTRAFATTGFGDIGANATDGIVARMFGVAGRLFGNRRFTTCGMFLQQPW